MSKDKQKGEIITQLQRDIVAYDTQLQRILGAKTYAEALLKSLMEKKETKKENKDAVQKSRKDNPS